MNIQELQEKLDQDVSWLCEGFISLYVRGYYDNVGEPQLSAFKSWCQELKRLYNSHKTANNYTGDTTDPDHRNKIWTGVITEIDGIFKAKEGLFPYILYAVLHDKLNILIEIQEGRGNPVKYQL
jgi:hypothetical protein